MWNIEDILALLVSAIIVCVVVNLFGLGAGVLSGIILGYLVSRFIGC